MGKFRTYRLAELTREAKKRRKAGLPASPKPAVPRPKTRADCVDGPRPCPWVGCRYHLYLDARPSGALRLMHGDDVAHLQTMPETCALDCAAKGPHDYDYLARAYNLTRQQVQSNAEFGMAKLAAYLMARDLSAEDSTPSPTPAGAFDFDLP